MSSRNVTIVTNDAKIAELEFDFVWGQSDLLERLRALEELVGSQAELIRLAGIENSTYRMARKRASSLPTERAGAIAKAAGVSLDYLVWGTAITMRDGACEEVRFDLAVRDFTLPSSPDKRKHRDSLIAEARIEVEDNIASLANGTTPPTNGDSGLRGYVAVRPLMSTPGHLPQLPLALSETWIAERHLSGEALRFLPVVAEEGGAEFAAGSIVLIDCDQVIGGPGAIFAMNIGGETQLRRIVRRLSSSVELVHINPSWPTETVKKIADAPILGAVVFAFGPV